MKKGSTEVGKNEFFKHLRSKEMEDTDSPKWPRNPVRFTIWPQ